MIQSGLIPSAHTDIVTDAQYDYYGLRLATCGLDQRIKVWQQDETTHQWTVEDDWKAHDAPLTSLAWAHPEFGATILASGSLDRTVKIWERSASSSSSSTPQSKWSEVATLSDAKAAVHCLSFGPVEFGLKLATLSTDSTLRLYECLESATGVQWELRDEIDLTSPIYNIPSSSSSSEGSEWVRAAKANLQSQSQSRSSVGPVKAKDDNTTSSGGGWSFSWCKEHYWGAVLAVVVPGASVVRCIQLPPGLRATVALTMDVPGVSCVAWAPLVGRSHHLVATGSRDGRIRVFKVYAPAPLTTDASQTALQSNTQTAETVAEWKHEEVANFDEHGSFVSKVEWNLTGTVLASSGHDGRVRLWKASYSNVWRPMGYVTAEEADDVAGAGGKSDVVEEGVED